MKIVAWSSVVVSFILLILAILFNNEDVQIALFIVSCAFGYIGGYILFPPKNNRR